LAGDHKVFTTILRNLFAISRLTDRSVQFIGASATADPYLQTWIGCQSNRLVRNRHVVDEFVPQQRVSVAKHAVSIAKHTVSIAKHVVSVVRHVVTTSRMHSSHDRIVKSPVSRPTR
jgi:hypothetical protein